MKAGSGLEIDYRPSTGSGLGVEMHNSGRDRMVPITEIIFHHFKCGN